MDTNRPSDNDLANSANPQAMEPDDDPGDFYAWSDEWTDDDDDGDWGDDDICEECGELLGDCECDDDDDSVFEDDAEGIPDADWDLPIADLHAKYPFLHAFKPTFDDRYERCACDAVRQRETVETSRAV